MQQPASQRTAAAMEAGFARGGLESTVQVTVAHPPAPAPAAQSVPAAAGGQPAGSAQQPAQSAPQRQVVKRTSE